MRLKTSALWPFLFFAASAAAASAADEAAAAVEATATDAAGIQSRDSASTDRCATYIHPLHCPVSFSAHSFLLRSDLSYLMFMSSSPCCQGNYPPVSRFCDHPFLSSHRITIFEFHGYVICHHCHVFVPTPSSLRSIYHI